MVNFGPRATVPEKFESRQLFEHNPVVTLMRTSPEECKSIGEFIVEKVKKYAQEPSRVQLVLPKGGVSIIATPGAPFHDVKADNALFEAIENGLEDSGVLVSIDDRAINEEGFAVDVAQRMAGLMGL
jgi:uncharacterized protein (UPF0261 family)